MTLELEDMGPGKLWNEDSTDILQIIKGTILLCIVDYCGSFSKAFRLDRDCLDALKIFIIDIVLPSNNRSAGKSFGFNALFIFSSHHVCYLERTGEKTGPLRF